MGMDVGAAAGSSLGEDDLTGTGDVVPPDIEGDMRWTLAARDWSGEVCGRNERCLLDRKRERNGGSKVAASRRRDG